MLILTRKRSETIRIGDDILIKVIKTGRNTVKLGIEAPSEVRVLRGELLVEGAAPERTAPERTATQDTDILELKSKPMAVALWNGGNRETNGQKGLAGWILLDFGDGTD